MTKSLSIGALNLDEDLNHAVDKLDTQFKEYDVHRVHYDALALLEEGEANQAQKKSTLKNVTEYMNLNKILEVTFPFRAYKALIPANRSKNSSLTGSEQKLKEASVKAISDYIKNLKGRVDKIGFDVINDVIRGSPLFLDFLKIYTEATEPKVKGYLKKITDRFLLGDKDLLSGIPESFLFHYQCVVFGDRKDGKSEFHVQLFFNYAHNLLSEVFDANDMGRKLIKWFESEKNAPWNVSTLLVLSSASNPAEVKHTNSYKKWLDEIRQYVDCKLPEEVKSTPEVYEFFQRISLTVNDG